MNRIIYGNGKRYGDVLHPADATPATTASVASFVPTHIETYHTIDFACAKVSRDKKRRAPSTLRTGSSGA